MLNHPQLYNTPAHSNVSPAVGSLTPDDRLVPIDNGLGRPRRNSPYTPINTSPLPGFLPHINDSGGMLGNTKRGFGAIEEFQQTVKKSRTGGSQGLDCLALAIGLREKHSSSALSEPPCPDKRHSVQLPGVHEVVQGSACPDRRFPAAHSMSVCSSDTPPPLSAGSSWGSEASFSSMYPSYSRPFSSTRSTTFSSAGLNGLAEKRPFARTQLDAPLMRPLGHTYMPLSSSLDRYALDDYEIFLEQHRDINSLDLGDLPTSLSSPTELQQLNEGVLQMLPDLTDVNGRSLFIDQMVQQLDSSNPNSLNDLLMMGNLHPASSPDPLLSSATTTGMYANMAPANPMGFDLAASPEASAPQMRAPGFFAPGVSQIMSYPTSVGAQPNPTLTDLAAGTVPAVTASQLDLSRAQNRIASQSPSAPNVPDAMLNGRPIARPRGYSNVPMPQQMPGAGASLYSGLYTPLQMQQQQMQQQMHAQHYQQQQQLMAQAAMGSSPQTLQRQRMPMPNAQAVDPMAYQARMQALMAYRAMGLQCTAPGDEAADDDDDAVSLSLDEWLNTENLTEAELAGSRGLPSSAPVVSIEEPELEEPESAEAASVATSPVVRRSIAVQKSFAKRAVADVVARSTDEPVSYLRRRSHIMAEQQQQQQQQPKKDDDAASRKELAEVAVQLLVRINTMYLRKIQEQKREAEAEDD
ncbi:hypothetical protein GGF43_004807, partial [Coemansia sp. RSA 2618]